MFVCMERNSWHMLVHCKTRFCLLEDTLSLTSFLFSSMLSVIIHHRDASNESVGISLDWAGYFSQTNAVHDPCLGALDFEGQNYIPSHPLPHVYLTNKILWEWEANFMLADPSVHDYGRWQMFFHNFFSYCDVYLSLMRDN